MGWDLDLGAIQRSTKFGVDYNANDFVAMGGSSSELVPRSEWGSGFYGIKIEGASTMDYTYDAGRKHAVKTVNLNGTDHHYSYDDNGNMLSGPNFTDPQQLAQRTISFIAVYLGENLYFLITKVKER